MTSERLFWLLLAIMLHSALSFAHYEHTVYVDYSNPNATDDATCGSHTHPCCTFSYAVSERVLNSTQVVVSSGNYLLNHTISLSGLTNIALTGVDPFVNGSSQPVVIVTCESGAGLSFVHSSDITIQNVHFSGCGALQNSTSRNFSDHSFSFMQFPVGVYFLFCQHINLTGVSVTNSTGTGMAVYATGGLNYIHNCSFLYNRPPNNEMVPSGGGLYIEFPFCDPQLLSDCDAGNTSIPPQYSTGVEYRISECVFGGNRGHMWHPVEYIYLLPQDTNHLTFGHGGGLSVFFSEVENSSVAVERCVFENNEAEWGGGVFVDFQELSRSNHFSISSSVIRNNTSFFKKESYSTQTTGGGGMRLEYMFTDDSEMENNSIVVDSCLFQHNRAYWGGGVSFSTARERRHSTASNSLTFCNCTWDSNYGRTGSAIDLSIWNKASEGATVTPVFSDCAFVNNNDNNTNYSNVIGDIIGVGTLYTSCVSIIFEHSVVFEDNNSSALASVDASLDFMDHCDAIFYRNSGRSGGAISLFGSAYIKVHNYTNMQFINNSASQYGGAIHCYAIDQHTLAMFGNCFIQYQDILTEPWNWTARFFFKGNTATYNGGRNSISAVSLYPCLWDYYSMQPSTQVPSPSQQLFCWNENWVYDEGSCEDEISSAPAAFNTSKNGSRHMELILGRPQAMPVEVLDDKGVNVSERVVYTARSLTPDLAQVPNNSFYISDSALNLVGIPNSTAAIQLETLGPRVLTWELDVTVLPCPPGFAPQTSENSSLAKCVCDESYGGRVKCNEASFTAKLQRGHWMGVDSSLEGDLSKQLLVGMSPYTASAMDSQYVELPNKTADLDGQLCEPVGREGIMCGRCRQGYGLAVNTKQIQCVRCSDSQAHYMWVFYILSQLLPITIMFLIFVLLHVSTTTGPANAFILFAQLLTTTFSIEGDETVHIDSVTSHYDALQKAYTIPYDIWNLNFFFFPPTCLSPHLSTQAFLSLDFLVAAYPLILIALFYGVVSLYDRGIQPVYCLCRPLHNLFARFQHQWNLQHSTIDAFATFLVLSYNKFTVTSVYLLTSDPLVDSLDKTVTNVLYLDGNVHFLSNEHLPYFFLALCILLTIVTLPPLLLLVYPLRLIQRLSNWFGCKKTCCKINTGGRMQMFLDTFQGCFKDGTNGTRDYRYFAGVYFILRILFFTLYAYTGMWIRQYFIQQLFCTVAVLLFAVFRPYKKDFYNNLDATIFGVLALINAVSMYNIYFTSLDQPASKWAFAIQYILIFCPLVYMVVYVMWAVIKNNRQKLKKFFRFGSVDENTTLLSSHHDDGSLDAEFLAFAAVMDDQSHQVIHITPPRGRNTGRNSGPQGAGLDLSTSPTSSRGTSGVIRIHDYSYERNEGGRRSEGEHRTDHLTEGEGQGSGREEERGERGGTEGRGGRGDSEVGPSRDGHHQHRDRQDIDEDHIHDN